MRTSSLPMRIPRKPMLLLLALVLAASAATAAEEKPAPPAAPAKPDLAQDPYMKLAMARARVEIALRDAGGLFSPDKAWNQAWQEAEQARNRVDQTLDKASEAEMAKADAADPKFIADSQARKEAAAQEWNDFCQKERLALQQRYDEVVQQSALLQQALQGLSQQEEVWKSAKLDLAILEAGYLAMEKRLQSLADQAAALLAEAQKTQKRWEAAAEAVAKFAAGRAAAKKEAEKAGVF